eukprot:1147927-Pelagomonas_calceolata.AAC.8
MQTKRALTDAAVAALAVVSLPHPHGQRIFYVSVAACSAAVAVWQPLVLGAHAQHTPAAARLHEYQGNHFQLEVQECRQSLPARSARVQAANRSTSGRCPHCPH